MKVLFGCEESQACTIEFRKRGHEAYSCDTQSCSGGHPEWHLQMDVFDAINGGMLVNQSGELIIIEKWDMLIGFPPCTHLAVSGAAWFDQKIKDGRQQEGIDFFVRMVNAEVSKIAIENPVGIMSTIYKKPSQIIHPYYFGDDERKATCLWLKNLPKLIHIKTKDLFYEEVTHVEPFLITSKTGNKYTRIHGLGSGHSKERSKTFPGIARAMAEQWG